MQAVQQHRKAWQQKSPERDKDLKSMVQQIADQQLPDLQPILKSFPDASEVLENLGEPLCLQMIPCLFCMHVISGTRL